MRTKWPIGQDESAAARELAENRSESLGKSKVVSDLIRRGLEAELSVPLTPGVPVFEVSQTASPLTLAEVKRDEDEG